MEKEFLLTRTKEVNIMHNKNNNSNNNDSATNHQLGMLVLFGLAAAAWKYESAIRLWFYKNVLFLTMGGIFVLVLLGFYLWHRIKKKEKEHFERKRILRQVQTTRRNQDFYKRDDFDE